MKPDKKKSRQFIDSTVMSEFSLKSIRDICLLFFFIFLIITTIVRHSITYKVLVSNLTL